MALLKALRWHIERPRTSSELAKGIDRECSSEMQSEDEGLEHRLRALEDEVASIWKTIDSIGKVTLR